MTRTIHRILGTLAATVALCGLLAVPAQASTDNPTSDDAKLILLMDASGSMNDPDANGSPRIDAARTALDTAIDALSDDQQVGLRVFGANVIGLDQPGACTDSDLTVPIGTDNKDALHSAVAAYTPYGETPMGYALQQAGADLGNEGQRSILLVSDGLAECDPDPCDVAADLRANGVDLTINVVGMNVDDSARQQLQCIADAGGGTYYDATDADSLTSAMSTLETRAFRPFSIAGEPITGTPNAADAPSLTSGTAYVDIASKDVKNYRIDRTMPGSTIHISVIANPSKETSGWLTGELLAPNGDSCGNLSGGVWQVATVSADEFFSSDRDTCVEADSLTLQMSTSGDDGAPFQLQAYEEPPVTNADDLPAGQEEIEDGSWSFGGSTDGSDGEVQPGTSFNDAPLVDPGSYRADFESGEAQFYRVHLEWGQSLRVRVDFDPLNAAQRDALGVTSAYLDLHQPLGGIVSNNSSPEDADGRSSFATLSDGSGASIVRISPAVTYHNRDDSSTGAASYPGDYYVSLATEEITSTTDLFMMPYTISFEVVGTAGDGAPTYASDTTTASPAATATATPTETASTAPSVTPAKTSTPAADAALAPSGAPVGLVVGLGAAGAVLVAAGVFWVVRIIRRQNA
ncbi:MAG: VWA domain-containing protein [Microbacterium sp.]